MALKDKYPFINQLHYNDILADLLNAVDSVDGDINALVSGYSGTNASTKKIYYHPIYFYVGSGADPSLILQMAIFDNNATAYDSTTFKTKLKSLLDAGAIINCNGILKKELTDNYSQVFAIRQASGAYKIMYASGSAYYLDNLDIDNTTFSGFTDGVNAIN